MKTILKTAALVSFAFAVNVCIANPRQVSNGSTQVKKDQPKKAKSKKAVDNKIAVSDQARPSDKSGKKSSGISNK